MNKLIEEIKFHFIVNKISYFVLMGMVFTFLIFHFNGSLYHGDGKLGLLLVLMLVIIGIPLFGIVVVVKSHKADTPSKEAFLVSIFSPVIIITALFLLYFFTTSISTIETLRELLLSIIFPLMGLGGLLILIYFYLELFASFHINWKRFYIRTLLFILYFVVEWLFVILMPSPATNYQLVNTVVTIISSVFLIDIAIYVLWLYNKEKI